MKKIVIFFLLMLSLNSCVAHPPNFSSPENYQRLLNQTALLTEDYNLGAATCSGFFISRNEVVTARHCVIPRAEILISGNRYVIETGEPVLDSIHRVVSYPQFIQDATLTVFDEFEVVAEDSRRDLAVLRSISEDYTAPAVATIRGSGLPVLGAPVVAIGHPSGISFNISPGIISSRSMIGLNEVTYLYPSTLIYQGNSGGPLFDERNNVIGIAQSLTRGVTHLSRFVSYLDLREFLEENGI